MSVAHTLKPKFLAKSKDLVAKLAPHLVKDHFVGRRESTVSQPTSLMMKRVLMQKSRNFLNRTQMYGHKSEAAQHA